MSEKWFEDYLKECSPQINWEEQHKKSACSILKEIAAANGGISFEDAELSEKDKKAFALQKADDAIQRELNGFAATIRANIPGFYYSAPVKENMDDSTMSDLHVLKPKLDINRATFDELEALPGIGPITAQRILEYRELNGPIEDIDELKKVKGIGSAELEKFSPLVFILPKHYSAQFLSKQLVDFALNPSFLSYINLISQTKGGFSIYFHEVDDIQVRIVKELTSIKSNLLQNKFFAYRNLPLTRATNILELNQLSEQASKLEENAIAGDNAKGGLLFDTMYLNFVKNLILNAQKSVKVIMFFLKYVAEDKYPTDDLIDALIDARKRGLPVQVILDKDRKEDVFKSRIINKDAFDLFKQNDIDVVFDTPERATHTKLVIVDESYIVLGSHNWTAGSMFAYDDTSMFIDSPEVAKNYLANFQERFDTLKNEK